MMFQAKALAIIEMQHMLNGRVAKGRMSQADADQEIQDDINDLKEEFGKARLLVICFDLCM